MNTGNNPEKNYYTIGEVSEITDVKTTVLRFWETEFGQLKPIKNKFGHRIYTRNDIDKIEIIKNLLYEKGLTIKGAKNFLKDNLPKAVGSEESKGRINFKHIRMKLMEILSILKNEIKKD